MSYKSTVEFANLICKFGRNYNLLDLSSQIVLPAIFADELRRTYSDTKYLFLDQQVIKLKGKEGVPIILVAGRFVKDTILNVEQTYDEYKGLVKEEKTMASAPSSVFCIVLNDHRVVYLREMKGAPDLSAFKATLSKFIKIKRRQYIEYLSRQERGVKKEIKQRLQLKIPVPYVDIVPLASRDSLREFVEKFSLLTKLDIKIKETNNEHNFNPMFEYIDAARSDIGSENTTLSHQNKEGLDKEGAVDQAEAAVKQGTALISFTGKDEEGGLLKGSSDEFKLRIKIEDKNLDVRESALNMYKLYELQKDKETIIVPARDEREGQLISELSRDFDPKNVK